MRCTYPGSEPTLVLGTMTASVADLVMVAGPWPAADTKECDGRVPVGRSGKEY